MPVAVKKEKDNIHRAAKKRKKEKEDKRQAKGKTEDSSGALQFTPDKEMPDHRKGLSQEHGLFQKIKRKNQKIEKEKKICDNTQIV